MRRLFRIISILLMFSFFGFTAAGPLLSFPVIALALYLLGEQWWKKTASLEVDCTVYSAGIILTALFTWLSWTTSFVWPIIIFMGFLCFLYILDKTRKGDQ